MTSAELTEWQAYYALEPFGEWRADLRSGMAAASLFNLWRGENPPRKPSDFMLSFEPPEPPRIQSQEEQRKICMAMAMAFAPAPVKKKKKKE